MAKSVLLAAGLLLSAAVLVSGELAFTAGTPPLLLTSPGETSDLPWYVTTAAIHRMMLKPTTKYWRFEHLSLTANEAANQLKESA